MFRLGWTLSLLVGAGCVLPEGEPCCSDDVDCVQGARCFEGLCAPRCEDELECEEGQICAQPAGVCREENPGEQLERCPYDEDQP